MINKYFLAKMNIPAYLKKFLYNRYNGIEIEGIPPITFQGNGKNLLDYRIYGASRAELEIRQTIYLMVYFCIVL